MKCKPTPAHKLPPAGIVKNTLELWAQISHHYVAPAIDTSHDMHTGLVFYVLSSLAAIASGKAAALGHRLG